jgi:hypothetical protein
VTCIGCFGGVCMHGGMNQTGTSRTAAEFKVIFEQASVSWMLSQAVSSCYLQVWIGVCVWLMVCVSARCSGHRNR